MAPPNRVLAVLGASVLTALMVVVTFVGLFGLGSSAAVTPSVATPYAVTFGETGLPNGTNWSVHVAYQGCSCDGVYRTVRSNQSTLTIPVTNGTYKYRVLLVPDFYVNSSFVGTFNVTGANVSVPAFVFHPLVEYNAEITETGLPSGTNWSVSLHGNGTGQLHAIELQTAWSTGSAMNFSLPNGTYHYKVAAVPGSFFLDRSSVGHFVVAGTSPTPSVVKFTTPVLYAVTFTESGLVNGTNWSVRVNGWGGVAVHEQQSGTNDSIVFELPNGTYHYALSEVLGFNVVGSTVGSFLLGPHPLSVNVTYRQVAPGAFYPVAFQETGLANGTHWSVRVVATHTFGFSRTETQSSNGTTVFFLLQNSSYRFQVHTVRGYQIVSGGSGTFGIFGTAPSVFVVTFKLVPTYAVTVNESGLDNGTNWSVLLRSQSLHSTPWPIHVVETGNTTSITFYVPNGTYCFVVRGVAGYTITTGPASGSLTVAGAPPAPVSVVYTPRV